MGIKLTQNTLRASNLDSFQIIKVKFKLKSTKKEKEKKPPPPADSEGVKWEKIKFFIGCPNVRKLIFPNIPSLSTEAENSTTNSGRTNTKQ